MTSESHKDQSCFNCANRRSVFPSDPPWDDTHQVCVEKKPDGTYSAHLLFDAHPKSGWLSDEQVIAKLKTMGRNCGIWTKK